MVVMKNVEIPNWLKGLPFAPVFRPTETEFADPIAYISKIEKQASAFGICKIIPPLPKPSKKYVLDNLNRSLSKSSDSSASHLINNNLPDLPAVFTTRQQALGKPVKKSKAASQLHQLAVHNQVWQSGEVYTLQQFETKSKAFSRSLLSMVQEVSPLVLEAMFWNATTEKPIYIEYANDVPGSGFSEPEGSHRYFLKRSKRRRLLKENLGATSGCKKNNLDTPGDSVNDVNSVTSGKVNLKLPIKVEYSGSSTISLDETLQVSKEKNSTATSENEMEGNAGWKLSNSPWNLQVIARSPGSLTRFMPDDIPGVTSPMVYIGMMFSWFAWHVEDHELHSMNYLHTGSPKTWYAVPGDYAFKFEEVIRTQAYGGKIDRLGALKLLGAKTTLLSPEVVVAARIPCCRLIQHPGEFVVTFPRAYHVGFSHGFNCGEAANFGTPQWLQVAKEAAVRRAAMNHLPMLSHQQLLYLLTMSFVSRFPRSLLPGVRNSRLRDRQKEEREKAVKQAFIEDIVKENKLSTVLLAKDPSYRAVSWHPESLPSYSKESLLAGEIAAAATNTKSLEIAANSNTRDNKNTNLFDEMRLFMETGNEVYLDDEDLSCDFQVGYGSLACVACGILGFPFVSIIQPSHRAAIELARSEYSSTSSQSINTPNSLNVDGGIMGAVSENLSPVPDISLSQEDISDPSTTVLHKGWNTLSGFLKPQIFCLEHAVQIEKLLKSRGGANVLLICHSDYQKMKAHATVISEEIGCSFISKEIPLVCASQKDLDLINHAIEEEVHDEFGQDWTSKLGINLRHSVMVRKKSPPKSQHVLTLSGLNYDTIPASTSHLNWESRRSRSKLKFNNSKFPKICKRIKINQEEPREILDGTLDRKEDKIIRYTRRKRKFESGNTKISSTCINVSVEAQHEYQTSDKFSMGNKACHLETNDFCKIRSEMKICEEANTRSLTTFAAKSSTLSIHTPVELQRDILMEEANLTNNTEVQYDMQADNDLLSNMACDLARPASSQVSDLFEASDGNVYTANCHSSDHKMVDNDDNPENVDGPVSRKSCAANKCSDSVMEAKMLQEIQITDRGPAEESASGYDILMYQPSIDPICISSDVSKKTCCVEDIRNCSFLNDKVSHGAEANRAKEIACYVPQRNQPNVVPVDETGTAYDLTKYSGPDNKILSFVAVEDSCEVLKEISTDKNLHMGAEVILEENNELKKVESCTSNAERKRKREAEHLCNNNGFFKSPCEGLRPRARKDEAAMNATGKKPASKKVKKAFSSSVPVIGKKEKLNGPHRCGLDGCRMKFKTKSELETHKHNHEDDRPLKCSWKGCKMSFRWAWARTEHLRVHTGERPYHCKVEGCGLSFRFISEFSRHRRKTRHYVN